MCMIIHMIDPLAESLNNTLRPTVAYRLLSDMGQRMFFPKGIIAQGAEAKKFGKKTNATIGMAVEAGEPLILPSVKKEFAFLSAAEAVAYAPTAGNPEFRRLWKEQLIKKNPSLKDKTFSIPVVTPGLTAGISYICDLFLSSKDTLLTTDPSWDNYSLIAETRCNAKLERFQLFTETGFNRPAFEEAVKKQAAKGSLRLLLNFPQNPSGYSPTTEEEAFITSVLLDIAKQGTDILVLVDDAYFGLNYEPNIAPESLFASLCNLHENIFAVKIDGPTKEDFAWGFRAGFLTFGSKDMVEEQYEALIRKLMGIIRSSVSCGSTPAQSIMIRTINNPKIESEKKKIRLILEERYRLVRNFVDTRKDSKVLTPLPFNSGYFMCFKCHGIDAEDLRNKLLHEYQIGTIALGSEYLRIAFSSIDSDLIEEVYSTVYKAAEELA